MSREAGDLWTSRTGFVLATVGSAVGLGNVWRFPYVCYDNGGGAFLIPYFIALFTTGIPLLILEFSLGHKMRAGAPKSFARIREGMQWLGWMQVMMCLVVVAYYAVVMAWCWVYLVDAFTLRWGADSSTHFLQTRLGLTEGPLELGGVQWPVLAGLATTWLAVFLSVFRGVKAVGVIVKITVPLPILLLVIFVIRAVTLPGASEGLSYFLTPDFEALRDPEVWLAAYGQVFFSSSLAFGVMIAYASYLPKSSDVSNNAFMAAFANSGTSFFAGFAVFGALGFLAAATGSSVEGVVESGPGLVFVTYPTIIAKLPFWAPVFGILFFLMLLTLGIDSAFSLVEGIVAGLGDAWTLPKGRLTAVVCTIGFLTGLIYVTGAGLHWLDIVDHFLTNLALPFVGLLECVLVAWFLKARVLREHANATSDFRIGRWWDVCVGVITPLFLGAMLITYLVRRITEPYGSYPTVAIVIGGWGMLAALIVGGVWLARLARRKESS